MKNINVSTYFLLLLYTSLWTDSLAQSDSSRKTSFTFAFLTDIHLKPEMDAPVGFQMAIDKVNALRPDFVISGGDQVFDVMRGNQSRGDSLFTLYVEMCKGFDMPVYNTVGNHDLFGIYEESPEDENHPDYKYGMYERYLGKTYYSFDHKGWHFIVLNSLDITDSKRYKAAFNQEQLEWLEDDLVKVSAETPIIVVTHIPIITARPQITGSSQGQNVQDAAEVMALMENHNLKLILQGHIHWKEYGQVNDRFYYITGGSIAGNGWKGRRHNTKEGFVLVKVDGEDFSWEYIDHGWEDERIRRNRQY